MTVSKVQRSFPPICVVMALAVESDGLFEAEGVPVVFCGVGKVNAAIVLSRELCRYTQAGRELPLVVNFGTAGSRVHEAGAFVACHEFIQRDMDVRGLGFEVGVTPFDEAPALLQFAPRFESLPTGLCGSGDSFALEDCGLGCAVVDMEAYALAKACRVAGAQFACVKYVTDGANQVAADDWRNNVHRAAARFLALYKQLDRIAAGE